FSVEFNGLQKQRSWVLLAYVISPLLLFLVARSDFIIGSRQVFWGRHVIVGQGHTLFLLFWVIPLVSAFYNFYYGYKITDSPFERQRRRFGLLCFLIACLSGIDYIPNYGASFPYPLGFIFLLFFIIATTHSIAQYRLLDINLILKKASIMTFLSVAGAIFIYITPFYVQPYLYKIWGNKWVLFPISIAFLFGAGLFRIMNFIRHMEEIEISKKFAYRPILKKEAERIASARDMDEFLTYLARDLSSWVRLDYVGILVWNNRKNEFILERSHLRSKEKKSVSLGLSLSKDDALVVELLRRKKFLVCSELKYYFDTQAIRPEDRPFIAELIVHMHRLGAEITIPCFCEGKLLAIVNIGHKLDVEDVVTEEDLELFTSLSNNIARAVHDFILKQEKIELIVASQHILITAIEAKDSYTRGHTDRVAHYSSLIGKRMEKNLRPYYNGLDNLNWAAQLHDLGKIGIPDSILLKKGALDEQQWQLIKRHTIDGIKIITPMREWLGEDVCAGVLHHHENLDGSGYPSGQKGESIHLFARIIRVADAFDAMTTDRPYRPSLLRTKAIDELKRCKGSYFDPEIVDVLVDLYNNGEI
ncbi:MAG: HD domain-containing phosphohydrolase, partial [Candidatus Omnitrophota bacterium]